MSGSVRDPAGGVCVVPRRPEGERRPSHLPALAGAERAGGAEYDQLGASELRSSAMAVAAKSLEAFLIDQGTVTAETLEKARERQRDGKGLGDVLQEMGAIDPRTWAQALADHFGLPFNDRLPEDSEI